MQSEYFQYGLLIALAIALLIAAFTDMRRRQIDNWLNGAIVMAAPLWWWANGLSLWPDLAWQLGTAVVAFAVLCGLFAMRMMGGGDVKLLTALALWVEPMLFLKLLIIMALLGGILTIVVGVYYILRRQRDRISIPYGMAISAAGLWIIGVHYWPAAQVASVAG
ncbi:MAG: prepilin peptidase [Pontixanthobacter sp.]